MGHLHWLHRPWGREEAQCWHSLLPPPSLDTSPCAAPVCPRTWTAFSSFSPWFPSPVAQIKNPLAMQETQAQSLGWEDPLEKGMAIHSSILAWRIPWTEDPGGLQSMGCKELDTTEHFHLHLLPSPGASFHLPPHLELSPLLLLSPTVTNHTRDHQKTSHVHGWEPSKPLPPYWLLLENLPFNFYLSLSSLSLFK